MHLALSTQRKVLCKLSVDEGKLTELINLYIGNYELPTRGGGGEVGRRAKTVLTPKNVCRRSINEAQL